MFDKYDENVGTIELVKNESTGIATICINSYKRRNALNEEMIEQLSHVITQLEEWTTGRAVIIFGTNGFFSSGVDLNFVRKSMNSLEAGYHYSRLMHSNLSRFHSLPLLTVAAVDGKALGGGAEILTACDFRLMTRRAEIGFVQISVGVTPGWSGGSRLVNICGYTTALDLLMSGRLISGKEALDLGFANHLFNEITTTDQLINETIKWLEMYINCERNAIQSIKKICELK